MKINRLQNSDLPIDLQGLDVQKAKQKNIPRNLSSEDQNIILAILEC